MQFKPFHKIPRLNREIIVTEKIDGTNGVIAIVDGELRAGSRANWLLPGQRDNHGFGAWVYANKDDLMKLGEGYHYGEWYGAGIQRKYGLQEKRFALFNTERWGNAEDRPTCCGVVPILYKGVFCMKEIQHCLNILARDGSKAVPGFTKPEGVVVYHTAGNHLYKILLDNDNLSKKEAHV